MNYLRSELGYKLICNTARSKDFNKQYFDILHFDYSILFGGSLIINKNEEILYKETMNKKLINDISKILLKKSKTFSIYMLDELFNNDKNYKSQNAQYFDFKKELNKESYKIVASFKDNYEAYKIANEFDLVFIPYLNGDFGRFNLKNTSKENGNKILMDLINGQLKDAFVFGDDIGDLKMIQEAGVGVIMKNANESLKKEVRFITKEDNNNDGLARFLIEYLNLDLNKILKK